MKAELHEDFKTGITFGIWADIDGENQVQSHGRRNLLRHPLNSKLAATTQQMEVVTHSKLKYLACYDRLIYFNRKCPQSSVKR